MTIAAMPSAPPGPDLVSTYRLATGGGYDEFLASDGAPRRHWLPFLDALNDRSATERSAMSARLDRQVRETGIAYDIFADPTQRAQKWTLDLVPLMFSQAEWRWLERALVQRAHLFDRILDDLYGEQRLISDALIPADLVFSDSAFLHPCRGVLPRAGGLRFYAADLARGADGQWRVIDSHAETLAGAGFALANRMAHTHVAGDLFNATNAVRLASYFQEMQSALIAHSGRENARIALLTPGAHHEDYFSHAYIARYLGYLLVEGADLRTRGGQVYLKTLEGLQEIDLIVRCVDGAASDPLELDPTGYQAPSGLLRACRSSPRLVVNAIGSAVVQNRGLGPYLPRLTQHVLGEDLLLHDAQRWWLGDESSRRHVASRFGDLVVRKAQEGTGRPGQAALGRHTHEMSDTERDALQREIALAGARLVAEETTGFSTAPVFANGALAPRPFAVRFFVARSDKGYVAMPGGLAMTVDPSRAVALSAPDGHTRDVWVLSDSAPAHHVSLWRPAIESARVHRSQRVIQSRVADDLFWLGRYTERADWTMRVLRSALMRMSEDSGAHTGLGGARKCLEVLLTDKDAKSRTSGALAGLDFEDLCQHVVRGRHSHRTLERTLESLYRVAHLARDRLSLEAFRALGRFRPGDSWSNALVSATPGRMMDLLDEGLASVSAFNGLMHENMTRNFGWAFTDMGRRLERAFNLSEAMLALFIPPPEAEDQQSSLMLLLELADSFITYRSRYRLSPMLPLVLDLLLLDESNPRSLSYQLAAFSRQLEKLPEGMQGSSLTEDRRIILALLTSIRLADVERIAGEPGGVTLEKLLREQIELLPELSDAVTRHYFNLTDDQPHRLQTRSESGP